MLRSLYITGVFAYFLSAGFVAPFVAALGYVWIDTFNPQHITSSILDAVPVAQVMGAAALGSYFLLDRRFPPRFTLVTLLTIAVTAWATLTTTWAVVPDAAWEKWNWAFKTVMFSAFLPFFFRSRIQIESFIQLYVFALVVHFGPAGLKTLISGGGYGNELDIIGSEGGIGEGSTLCTVCAMLIPLILYLRRHTLIIPKSRWTDLGYVGLIVLAIAAAIGTYERTALVALVVVGLLSWLRSQRKILFGAACVIAAATVISMTSADWKERMWTIEGAHSEGRPLVWRWTLGFAAEHPLGGGFEAYLVDQITFPSTPLEPEGHSRTGVAFHSIYFEYLGEHGWIGLGLLFALIGTSVTYLLGVARRTKRIAEMQWARDLALTLGVALAALLAGGAFIEIGFLPMLWYVFALSTCLHQHVRRVLRESAAPGPSPDRFRWQRTRYRQAGCEESSRLGDLAMPRVEACARPRGPSTQTGASPNHTNSR